MSCREPCPEALYGEHGEPNTKGNCPYCGVHLGRPRVERKPDPDLDDWTDPMTVDRSPDDDPEGIAADWTERHYGRPARVWRQIG